MNTEKLGIPYSVRGLGKTVRSFQLMHRNLLDGKKCSIITSAIEEYKKAFFDVTGSEISLTLLGDSVDCYDVKLVKNIKG